ncbi:MAG: metallophosphoesterase [Chloroflexaceae bacterium]|nr:metallophosphoesterase [Chloroflexaceae bacterium]
MRRWLLSLSGMALVLAMLTLASRWVWVRVRPVRLVLTSHTTPSITRHEINPAMRRIIVSDLHLGAGDRLDDFDDDDAFAAFVQHHLLNGEPTELILAGDIFEFLQVRLNDLDDDDWSETAAVLRLQTILDAHQTFMQALTTFVAQPANQLTVLIGNHDFEMHYASAKALLRQYLSLSNDDKRLRFGISYEGGGVYLVHGNQFDSWNSFVNFEGISEPFEVVRGTQMVKEVFNDLEDSPLPVAPLLDNVKPSSAFFWYMVALPRLRDRASRRFVAQGLLGFFQVVAWPPPHRMPITGAGPGGWLSNPLLAGLWQQVAQLRRQRVARQRIVSRQLGGALADTVVSPVASDEVLEQVQVEASRQLRREIRQFNDSFAGAMLQIARSPAHRRNKLFVCGHTHLARVVHLGGGQRYINTGTWTEIIYDIATMRRQEQRYPFLEITYPDGDEPHASLLVWRGPNEAPQPWQEGPGPLRRHRRRLPVPKLLARLRPRVPRRPTRGRIGFARRRK